MDSSTQFPPRLARRLSLVLVSMVALMATPAVATPPAGYYLVWGDEFNGPTLDTTKWDYWVPGAFGNAVNVSNAVSLNGSNLVITTYTSNSVNYTAIVASDLKFRPRYGYYEASIKWGDTNGMWSAFWLRSPFMGDFVTDPYIAGGELDICEHRYVGDLDTNYIANIVSDNIHWDGYGTNEQNAGSDNVGNVATGFHTFGLWWNGPTYSFSIDGSQVWNGTPAPLFGSDIYIILSSQVQNPPPHWAGYIPPGGYPSQAASNVKLMVDYLHYYAPTNVLFWTGAASSSWNNSANWVSNYLPAATSDLTFSYLSGNNLNTVLGQNYSVDGLVFLEMKSPATIGGANTLTLGAGGIDMVATRSNVTINAPITVSANQRWALGMSNVLTMNGDLAGSATLTKAEYGTLILNGTNSFSGLLNVDTGSVTNDGIVLITRSAAIANAASPISIRNTGMGASTLQLSNSVVVPQNVQLAGRNTNVAAIEVLSGSGNSLNGGLTLTGGGSNYLLQSDSGATLTVQGTISAGGTATGTPLLILEGAGNFSIPGSIQNGTASALSLLKTNAGTLTLSGVNTYTGGTTNARGTLFIDGSLAGPLVVNGTLAGIGTVNGAAVVQSGEISPGAALLNSIGTLSFGSSLTIGPSVTTMIAVDPVTQTNSQLQMAGTLNAGGTLYVLSLEGSFSPGQTFEIFHAGAFAGNFSSLQLPSLDPGLAWDTDQLTNGILSVIALPQSLSLSNPGGGQWQLNWNYGTLQTATNSAGPYSDLPGATAPYAIPATNTQQFYRLRVN